MSSLSILGSWTSFSFLPSFPSTSPSRLPSTWTALLSSPSAIGGTGGRRGTRGGGRGGPFQSQRGRPSGGPTPRHLVSVQALSCTITFARGISPKYRFKNKTEEPKRNPSPKAPSVVSKLPFVEKRVGPVVSGASSRSNRRIYQRSQTQCAPAKQNRRVSTSKCDSSSSKWFHIFRFVRWEPSHADAVRHHVMPQETVLPPLPSAVTCVPSASSASS